MSSSELRKRCLGSILTGILFLGLFMMLSTNMFQSVRATPSDWSQWSYYRTITINQSKVSGTLQDLPVLINVTDNELSSIAKPDGSDIAFSDSDGNKLDHQIELYDSSNGHLIAWVRVPFLSGSRNTNLYMYYGNNNAPPQENIAGVWGSTYAMIQHLNEKVGMHIDSSLNANNATPYGGVSQGVESKIDGGDVFDGSTGYLEVSDDNKSLSGFNQGFTASFWINMHNTGVKRQTLLSKYNNITGQLGWFIDYESSNGSHYLGFFISPDGVNFKSYTASFVPVKNVWYFITVVWSSNQIPIFYVNGIKVSTNGTSKASMIFYNSGVPLEVGRCIYDPLRYFDGLLDEIRISNVSSSADWLLTNYNNQVDPASFCSLGPDIPTSGGPLVSNPKPSNNAQNVYTNPTLSIDVADPGSNLMMLVFSNNATGVWKDIATYENVPNGTYTTVPDGMDKLGVAYWWGVATSNGVAWTNETYSFTVTTQVLTLKWQAGNATFSPFAQGTSGVLTYDVNHDGIEEVFYAGGKSGNGTVSCLNGTDGTIIWSDNVTGLDEGCQPEMADLNKDGVPELIVPIQSPAGILALNACDGSTYWKSPNLGGQSWASPVVADIDGSGYPTIFISSTDVLNGLNSTGRITKLDHDGRILAQTFVWRPCAGGLSLADTDNDGQFELYMGDRYEYMTSDNDYGKGVQSYWASNLTLRWDRPDVLCSSHIPMLADVNHDGKLEVIVGFQRGGMLVLNSTDGSTLNSTFFSSDLPVHFQPSVYDIDGDGNLEALMADGFHYDVNYGVPNSNITVFDLVTWKVDATMNVGLCKYGPSVADVTGDSVMDVVACNYTGIFVFDYNSSSTGSTPLNQRYYMVGNYTGLHGILNHAVVQDVDGDGYNELLVTDSYNSTTYDARVYCFDTPARKPSLRPRSEVQFYSERRLGAAEYVAPPGSPNPIISATFPTDRARGVPVLQSHLDFGLVSYQKKPIDYYVSTSPDIGSDHALGMGNGQYKLTVSNLTYSTVYSWSVNATDGTSWNNETYTFTTEANPGWWNTSWPYRKELSVDPASVNANQTNFPLLVDFVDYDLQSKARPDGNDIVFTDSSNVLLNFSIESFTKIDGHLVAWVNLPLISSSSNTRLYMYYGNSAAGNQQNSTATWDSNFMAVLHLSEISGVQNDSTSYNNDGTPYGLLGAQGVPGRIDGSDRFNSTKDYVVVPSSNTLSGFTQGLTVSFWLNLNNATKRQTILNKYNTANGQMGWFIDFMPANALGKPALGFFISPDGSTVRDYYAPFTPTLNTWYYVTFIWSSSQIPLYSINGVTANSIPSNTARNNGNASIIFQNTGVPLNIGKCPFDSTRYLNGSLDEIEISNVSRSTAWITTCYTNQLNASDFLNVGSQETIPLGPLILNPSPADTSTNVDVNLNQLTFDLTDYQGLNMNFNVTTNPSIGSSSVNGVGNGTYSIAISNLARSTNYTWTISATDGVYDTSMQYGFTTNTGNPPSQGVPLLKSSSGNSVNASDNENLICRNQSTQNLQGENITNIYNWYRNNVSLTNLLFVFDTQSTTTIKDYSGYGNNGQSVGQLAWTNGVIGGAYSFDKGYIAVPGNPSLDGGGSWSEITVEEWIYPTSSEVNVRTIAKLPSYEMGFDVNGHLFAGVFLNTGNVSLSGRYWVTLNDSRYPSGLSKNTWYQVVFTFDEMGLSLYINGVKMNVTAESTTTTTGTIQSSGNEPLYIGWFDHFKGRIDEVRVFAESLSQQQILQRYQDTASHTSSSSTVVQQETRVGDVWKCQVIPTDSYTDGTPKFSNDLTILGQNQSVEYWNNFDSGTLNEITGVSTSPGETVTITNSNTYDNSSYAMLAANNGGSGEQVARAYVNITSTDEIYASAYFMVTQNNLVGNSDRVAMIKGVNSAGIGLFYAGWRISGGTLYWWLGVRSGSSYVWAYSVSTPSTSAYHMVEVHWKEDSSSGYAVLYVDGQQVASISGRNTANYGNCTQIGFGMPELWSNIASGMKVYVNMIVVDTAYINP